MAEKDRLNGVPFTCSNSRYNTNIEKGKPHGRGEARGSVFDKPLVSSNGYTLWLEHVIDRKYDRETLWLMWYKPDGTPTIPMSGEIPADQVKAMASRLAGFIKLDDK
jgi:hypothetical protein